MTPRFLPLLLAACLGIANAAEDVKPVAPADNLPKRELTGQLLYQFLVAEIAGSRGQLGLSADVYRDLARTTQDPRVIKRAAEIAFFARRYDAALEAARLWLELEPESVQARQMLTGLLMASGRTEDLTAHLARQLASAGQDLGSSLMLLNRTLHRYSDKKAVQRIVDQLTAPYAGIAEAHLARAQAAQAANDPVAAFEEIDKALVLRPDWEQAALMRAQLLFPRGTSEVAAYLGQFVAANPKALEARLIYARALVSERRYTEARHEFSELLAGNPDNGDVVYAMAVLSIQLNELAEAETYLKRLVELDYPEINAARLYLGQIAEDTQRWGEALKWFGQVAPGDQYLAARLRMAHVLAKQGLLEDARRHLQETAAASPKERAQLLIGEAQLLREAGRPDDAFAVLDNGLAVQADQVDLLYEAALAAERAGRPETMERYLRRLIELRPDHAHAYNALGYSLADRNLRLDEAARLVDKALELAPEDPFILDSRGWVLFRRGDSAGAIEVLTKAFALRADPEIAAHLGEVLWTAGRRDEAAAIWTKAAKASPDNETLMATIKRFKP